MAVPLNDFYLFRHKTFHNNNDEMMIFFNSVIFECVYFYLQKHYRKRQLYCQNVIQFLFALSSFFLHPLVLHPIPSTLHLLSSSEKKTDQTATSPGECVVVVCNCSVLCSVSKSPLWTLLFRKNSGFFWTMNVPQSD